MFLDDPKISHLIFFPRTTDPPHDLDTEILKFRINDEIEIGGVLYKKDKDLPTILLFHGNGEISTDYQNFKEPYFESGVNLAVADFRGYGFSTGRPIYSGLIEDAMPIYTQFKRWMNEEGYRNSLFVEGRSLGSVCAAEIGAHNPKDLKGVIFESGFASLYNIITYLFRIKSSEITPETLEPYSNNSRIRKLKKPTLIIHGTNDWIVPVTESDLIYEALPEELDKRLVKIEGATHNDIFYYKNQYFNPLQEFIEKYS